MDIYEVRLTKQAERTLRLLPKPIILKLLQWIETVRLEGLRTVRKLPGFHDEPLRGTRQGQRSIRLNKSWRAFYTINETGIIHFIEVIEVNKHEY